MAGPTSDVLADEQTGERASESDSGPALRVAVAGFLCGLLFVTALPGGFAAVLRLAFPYETAERLFPLISTCLVLPIALLAGGRTRRFGLYLVLGIVVTGLVLLGVTSLVLYTMIKLDL